MKTTDKQLRRLDAWIAEHVMGFDLSKAEHRFVGNGARRLTIPMKHGHRPIQPYTTDPAAALSVLKKCGPKVDGVIQIGEIGGKWLVYSHETENDDGAECETLELAICLFAKKLYSK